jgi:hypothetical protein
MACDRFSFLERHGAVHWRFRFLVASRPVGVLSFFAKHLFVAAIAWQRCDLRRRCAVGGRHELTEEKRPRPLELGGEPGRGLSLQSGSDIGLVRSACGRDVGGGESHFSFPHHRADTA